MFIIAHYIRFVQASRCLFDPSAGIFNLRGNIGSIHWYNRRKVTKENQLPYCRCVGLGTLIVGLSMILSGIVQAFAGMEVGGIIIIVGFMVGLSLIVYAQFKYNKGIF